jgi:hypothetical protein
MRLKFAFMLIATELLLPVDHWSSRELQGIVWSYKNGKTLGCGVGHTLAVSPC